MALRGRKGVGQSGAAGACWCRVLARRRANIIVSFLAGGVGSRARASEAAAEGAAPGGQTCPVVC